MQDICIITIIYVVESNRHNDFIPMFKACWGKLCNFLLQGCISNVPLTCGRTWPWLVLTVSTKVEAAPMQSWERFISASLFQRPFCFMSTFSRLPSDFNHPFSANVACASVHVKDQQTVISPQLLQLHTENSWLALVQACSNSNY